MIKCRYCAGYVYGQDNDNMGGGLYSKIYVCHNDDCRAVYEEWTTSKGVSVPNRNRWFNPKTKEYEK